MLIGLVGKKGSGKTETAKFLVENHGFQEVVFAEPVKRVTEIVFGFSYDMLLGDTPEKRQQRLTLKDPIWGMTPIEAMQKVGTDIFRNHWDKETWIKIAKRRIQAYLDEGVSVVISDCRFENEMDFIREIGGELWILYENEKDTLPLNQEEFEQLKNTIHGHESEISYQKGITKEDRRIHNPKQGLTQFHNEIEKIMQVT